MGFELTVLRRDVSSEMIAETARPSVQSLFFLRHTVNTTVQYLHFKNATIKRELILTLNREIIMT